MSRDTEFQDWLASLKEGDDVCIRRGSVMYRHTLHKIARMTPTQFVLDDDTRVNRETGRVRGEGYKRINSVTPQLRDTVELEKLKVWLTGLTIRHEIKLPLNVLRAMKKAHDEELKK